MKTDLTYAGPSIPLCEQIAETCMLQCCLMDSVGLQAHEPALVESRDAHTLLDRTLEVVHRHAAELAFMLRPIAERRDETAGPAPRSMRMAAGPSARRYVRSLPEILQEDYAVLSLVALNYQMLRWSADALDDAALADLAKIHLEDLIELVDQMSRLMPPLRASELSRVMDELSPRPSEAACA